MDPLLSKESRQYTDGDLAMRMAIIHLSRWRFSHSIHVLLIYYHLIIFICCS